MDLKSASNRKPRLMLGRRNYAINHRQISAPFSYDGSLFFNVDFFGFHYSYFEDGKKIFQFWKETVSTMTLSWLFSISESRHDFYKKHLFHLWGKSKIRVFIKNTTKTLVSLWMRFWLLRINYSIGILIYTNIICV